MSVRFGFNLFARVTPRGWVTVHVPACTPRVGLVHTACGHHSGESWEFSDERDELGGWGERRRVRAERRRMRRIARAYASAHHCTDAGGYEGEAEALAWLDALTTCPHCFSDGAPTGRAFVDEAAADAAPVELEYRCGNCQSFYTRERP
ncbi:hypothetical protein [Nocardia brasiliensis]|uniref:hypothetical protein n=1 Tax=Nocardia brasiliensis TaxID=37326 RepID=UPI0024568BD3|nr:hypothetical protein [Nocardia brasiliensis]